MVSDRDKRVKKAKGFGLVQQAITEVKNPDNSIAKVRFDIPIRVGNRINLKGRRIYFEGFQPSPEIGVATLEEELYRTSALKNKDGTVVKITSDLAGSEDRVYLRGFNPGSLDGSAPQEVELEIRNADGSIAEIHTTDGMRVYSSDFPTTSESE